MSKALKPKLLLINRQMTRGGAERRMIDLKNHLRDSFDIYVHPITGINIFTKEELIDEQGYISKPIKTQFGRFLHLRRTLKELKPAIIHSFDLESGFYCKLALLTLRQRPVLISGYGSSQVYSNMVKKILSNSLLMPNVFICNSSKGAESIRALVKPKYRVEVIRNGINSKRFHDPNIDRPSWKGENPVIGYIGKFDENKKGQRAVEIAKYIVKNFKIKAEFVLAGVGPYLEPAKAEVQQDSDLKEHVHFLGYEPNAAKYIRFFDIGILCSDAEGLPNVLLEFMSFGVPPISTNTGDVEYILSDGAGIVMEKFEAEEFALEIKKLLDNKKSYSSHSRAAKQRFEKEFTIESMALKYESFYKNCLNSTKMTKAD